MPSTMYSSWSRGFSRIRGRTSRKWASLDQRADITRRSSITTINWPMAVVTSRRETSSDQTKRVGVCTRIRTEDLLKLSRGIGPEFIWRYVREWSASATKLHGRACTSLPISLSLSLYLSIYLSLSLSLSTCLSFRVSRSLRIYKGFCTQKDRNTISSQTGTTNQAVST